MGRVINLIRKRVQCIGWRTPYTNENVVRVVGKDGYVYHKLADMKRGRCSACHVYKKRYGCKAGLIDRKV